MNSLLTIQSAAVPARVERARVWVWTFVPAFMLVHGIVATCLPEWLDPLSTVFIVLAEWTAIAACLGASRRASPQPGCSGFLLVGAIFLHSAAMSMDARTLKSTHAPMLNHVPAISVLLSMLWERTAAGGRLPAERSQSSSSRATLQSIHSSFSRRRRSNLFRDFQLPHRGRESELVGCHSDHPHVRSAGCVPRGCSVHSVAGFEWLVKSS